MGLFDELAEEYIHRDWLNYEFKANPAEGLRLVAFDHFYKKEYHKAINVLNDALKYNHLQTNPAIYELKADCYKELKQEREYIENLMKAIDSLNKIEPESYDKKSNIFMNAFRYFWDKSSYENAEKFILKAEEILENSPIDHSSKNGVYVWLARLYKKTGNTLKAKVYEEKSLLHLKIELLEKYEGAKNDSKDIYSREIFVKNEHHLSNYFPNLLEYLEREQSCWNNSKAAIIDENNKLELVVKFSSGNSKHLGIKVNQECDVLLSIYEIKDNIVKESIAFRILNDLDYYGSIFNAIEDYLYQMEFS